MTPDWEKKWKAVYIEWYDSFGNPKWVTTDEIAGETPLHCWSIGWLVHKDKEKVIIANTRGEEGGMPWCGTMTIPKGAIIKMKDMP